MNIRLSHVNFQYHQALGESLNDLNLTINSGQVIVLCGQSGCGKTSLTRLINGLIPEFYEGELSGELFLDNKNIFDYSTNEISRSVGSIFQNPKNQFFNLDTSDELTFICQNLAYPQEWILQKVNEIIKKFDLNKLLNRSIFHLSGGEAQKIACASIACAELPVIVLDEPSANLDFRSIAQLQEVITEWRQQGKTIIIAEHRLHYLFPVADLFVYLDHGKIAKIYNNQELSNLELKQYNQLGLRARSLEEIFQLNFLNQVSIQQDKKMNSLAIKSFQLNPAISKTSFTNIILYSQHVYAVIGNNGVGKSTFFKALTGLLKSAKGQFEYNGKAVKLSHLNQLIYLLMQDVNHQLFMETVLDEVLLSMRLSHLPKAEKIKKAQKILSQLKLEQYVKQHPMNLSGGEKQRLAIAAAVASEKPIILLDEPTSGLDYQHMLEVAKIIKKLQTNHLIMFTTHDPEFIYHSATNILFLENGIISKEASLADKYGRKLVEDFFKRQS